MAIPQLRPFQATLKSQVFQSWNQGAQNVVMQLATGGGKTVTLSSITLDWKDWGFVCIIAHRQELIGQLSLTLAKYGVFHRVICPPAVRRAIERAHIEALGRSYIDMTAPNIVASIDALNRQDCSDWAKFVTLWIVDEGHHVVLDNKWHKGIAQFTHPQCRGLLPTATPARADGKGLGRPSLGGHGVADVMVEGPAMRWLIGEKYLSDYRVVCPTSDLHVLGDVGATGDWSSKQLKEAAKRSHIVGDLVKGYMSYGWGKLGVTFCTDVETAMATTVAYRLNGIRAECLTGQTDDYLRREMLKRFERRELDQLVAVDIISEGFDLPAIECLSMGRPTASFPLYAQQFGRALRILEGKGLALIIDHVSNIIRHHGPPDRPRQFSLASKEARTKGVPEIPFRVCPECTEPYQAVVALCPACGHKPEPQTRSSPAAVDGDMAEMSPELLARLREDIAALDQSVEEVRSDHALNKWGQMLSNVQCRNHVFAQDAQRRLRATMAVWAGPLYAQGYADSNIQRAFFHRFGLSVPEAMALRQREAEALTAKLEDPRYAFV